MKLLKLSFLILMISGSVFAQNCPSSQATSVNLGLCGPVADHLILSPQNPSGGVNTTFQFSATVVLSDGTLGGLTNCDGSWSSSNTSVATINNVAPNAGLATLIAPGTTTIACTIAGSTCFGGNACTGSTTLTGQAPPIITTPASSICTQPCPLSNGLGPPSAQAYSYTFGATGGVPPYTWTVTVGSIPAWSSLNAATGALTGATPAVGVTLFTIQVCDTVPSCNSLPISLTVVANNTSFYPLSTTSQLSQNKVAGRNSNVPTALWGTAASTTASSTTNIVTINVANTFTAGSGSGACTFAGTCGDLIALSGFTTMTWLNGLILGANSSTTGTALVGPVFNTKGVQVTHADVASTAETTVYGQGPGINSFTTAIAPFAGSTNCTNGNPCAGQTGALTAADINSWGIDYSVNGTTGVNKNIWTMWTNPASTSNKVFHPSKTSETYDEHIGYPDASNRYFVAMVSSTINIASAHYAATGCGGQPCMLLDTPLSSEWYSSNSFGLACSQAPNVPTTNQSQPCYYVDISSPFDPKGHKQVYQYQATGCSGNPCVTLLSDTVIFDVPTICPAWKYTIVGSTLAYAKAVTVGSADGVHDTDLNFGLGTGPQNQLAKSMEFHIMNMNSTPTCENLDTAGRSGTTMYNDGTTAGLFVSARGTGYAVNDVISFSQGGTACVGTVKVTGVSGGAVNITGGLGLPTMTNNAGCVLGTALTVSGGSGTGLGLTESGVGTNSTPCCVTVWPSGSTSPTATSLFTFGIHGGTSSKGAPTWIANSGYGSTTQKPCGACDNIFWKGGTTTVIAQSSNLVAGHPAIGLTHRGTSTSPPYTVSLWADPTCTPSTNCVQIATLPTCPGGSINHSTWPSGNPMGDLGPISITSAQNTPGNPPQTNPENCSTAFGLSLWAVEQNSTTHWFAHDQENTNNIATEDPNGTYVEIICSPDRVFCMVPTDMKFGFTPTNVGLGTDSNSKPYVGVFALTLN